MVEFREFSLQSIILLIQRVCRTAGVGNYLFSPAICYGFKSYSNIKLAKWLIKAYYSIELDDHLKKSTVSYGNRCPKSKQTCYKRIDPIRRN